MSEDIIKRIKEIAVSGKTLRFDIDNLRRVKDIRGVRAFEDQKFVSLPFILKILEDKSCG